MMIDNIPRTVLGRTGIEVTRLGVGGAYCETADGYRQALDCGVNYLDTARAYRDGEDEKVVGEALQNRRGQIILATKTGQRSGDGARRELETSLRLLRTDYIDIYQLHHLNTAEEREKAFALDGALSEVQKAKEEGLIRCIGVTGHDWKQIGIAISTGAFDTVLCWYNCAMKEPEQDIFPQAKELNVGVVIMNAGRNDRLFSDSDVPAKAQFYRYVLSHPAVHLTVMGLRDIEIFQQVAAGLSVSTRLSEADKLQLEAYGTEMRQQGKLG